MCRAALMTSGFASALVARYLDCNVADVYQLETFAFDCFLFFFSWRTPPHTQQPHPLRIHLSSPWNTYLSTGLKLGGAWTSVIDGEGLVTDWEGRSAGTRVVFLSDCLIRYVWVYRCIRAEIISAIVGRYRCEGEWLVGGWFRV